MTVKFDVVNKRYWWFALSFLVIIPGLISMAMHGFNLGIDFTGGTILDLKFAQPVSVAEVRDVLKDFQLEGSTIQLASTEQVEKAPGVLIRTPVLTEETRRDLLADLDKKVGSFDVLRVEKVGAVIGSELERNAILAMVASWVLIVGYMTYRFEFKFAVCGILALIHDVLVILGLFSIMYKEIDTTFIAALLTIIGYSITDTIVIFDRIRENLKTHRKEETIHQLVNRSIWQSMTRSIYTVLTVLFAVVSLYVFGGETTKNFSLALIICFVSGAYSSIFNASQIWVTWREYADKQRQLAKMGAK
ncbi:MAG: protein translocase subunit SecF [Pelosinus sp.]|nr:protein translocase subunit SecF [Pelosinus sp.]